MFKITLSAVAALLALSFIPDYALAQSRVFVAAQGSDSNPCTFAAPCRTFQHAHNVMAANGEIDVLDPAGYGALTITKAISIQGHGFSGISAASGTAITISAGASDAINLRGLLLDGVGTGATGIKFNAGASLNIQDSIIRNFAQNGIWFAPTAASQLKVSQSVVSDLPPGTDPVAVFIAPSGSGTADVVLTHVELDRGFDGLAVSGNSTTGSAKVTIGDSVISNFTDVGILGFSSSGAIQVMIRNCNVSNNAVGVESNGSPAIVRITRSTITANGTGLVTFGGSLISYGDNNIDGNTPNGSPTSTIGYH